MERVYLLTHSRFLFEEELSEQEEIKKFLGFFSSEQKCKDAVDHYLMQAGFEKYPGGFSVEEIFANIDEYNTIVGEFKKSVFFLIHEYFDGRYEYLTEIGCYENIELANAAKEIYKYDLDLKDYPEGFRIEEYFIDHMEWEEGFITGNE